MTRPARRRRQPRPSRRGRGGAGWRGPSARRAPAPAPAASNPSGPERRTSGEPAEDGPGRTGEVVGEDRQRRSSAGSLSPRSTVVLETEESEAVVADTADADPGSNRAELGRGRGDPVRDEQGGSRGCRGRPVPEVEPSCAVRLSIGVRSSASGGDDDGRAPSDYESGLEKEVAGLKLQGVEALKRQDYLAASDLYTKEYQKACDALLDGLKMDPGNSEIENALREAMESLKISDGAKLTT
ncbi:hypothetical protein OsI_07295 [Oryza sativa Indica Group]|uniref:Uncharacterized protein n=1 Tax=Oryza sativa subsp. indica TaxID=39946 RepID=B8AI96_ORYSI|nr:hypothetical protein OsI_07295 [Oryza sativa Indica Group]